jgi:hypothetical protein
LIRGRRINIRGRLEGAELRLEKENEIRGGRIKIRKRK